MVKSALICGDGRFIGGHLVKNDGFWCRGLDQKFANCWRLRPAIFWSAAPRSGSGSRYRQAPFGNCLSRASDIAAVGEAAMFERSNSSVLHCTRR